MDLLEAVITRLLAASSVTGIVGTRVHKVSRPQGGALPALVVASVGGPPEDLDLQDEADSIESRVQFTAFANTNSSARAAVNAATALFVGSGTQGSFNFWEGTREPPVDGGQPGTDGFVHQVSRDIVLRHSMDG